MKRNFLFGAALGALVVAALAPWSASRANGISVRVNTPEFGIRIGAPHLPPPFYHPAPVYYPAPVYAPPLVVYTPPRYIAPPPVVYGYPYHYAGGRGYGQDRHYWRHPHWRHPHWRHHRHHDDDDRQRHWR